MVVLLVEVIHTYSLYKPISGTQILLGGIFIDEKPE